MFLFAVTATAFLYVYWDYHTRPFRPLREALAREFEGSHPLVQGGQRKIHKGTPRILRIVLRVPFDPTDEANEARIGAIAARVERLAGRYRDLDDYDALELHLAWVRPEKETRQRKLEIDLHGERAGETWRGDMETRRRDDRPTPRGGEGETEGMRERER